jgi:hypothetical protein
MHGLDWAGHHDDAEALIASTETGQRLGHVHSLRLAGQIVTPPFWTFVWRAPWRLGVGHAFNAGVALGLAYSTDLALMLGADDRLEPRALEHLAAAYESHRAEGLYWLDVIYSDGEEQRLPCNASAFTRGWFRESGGLPVEASAGGMDAALVSAMLVHRPRELHHVSGPEGRYWVRRHAMQEGARLNAYAGAMIPIRDTFTQLWEPTKWGRYE